MDQFKRRPSPSLGPTSGLRQRVVASSMVHSHSVASESFLDPDYRPDFIVGDMFEKEPGSPKTVLDSTVKKYELEKMMGPLYKLEFFQKNAKLNVTQKEDEKTSAACLLEEKVKQDPVLELEGGIKDLLSIKNGIADLEPVKQDALPVLEGANKDNFSGRVEFAPTEMKNLQDLYTMLIVKISELEEQSLTFSNHFNELTDSFESCLKLALQEKDIFSEYTLQKLDHIQLANEELINKVLELQNKKEFERVQHVEQCRLAEEKTQKLEYKVELLNGYLRMSEGRRIRLDRKLENLSLKYRILDNEYREVQEKMEKHALSQEEPSAAVRPDSGAHSTEEPTSAASASIPEMVLNSQPRASHYRNTRRKKDAFVDLENGLINDDFETNHEEDVEDEDQKCLEAVIICCDLGWRVCVVIVAILLVAAGNGVLTKCSLCYGEDGESRNSNECWCIAIVLLVLLWYVPYGVLLSVSPHFCSELRGMRLHKVLKLIIRCGSLMASAYVVEYVKDIESISIVVLGALAAVIFKEMLVAEEVGFLDIAVSAAMHSGLAITKGIQLSPLIMFGVAVGVCCFEELNNWVIRKLLYMRVLVEREEKIKAGE